MKNMKKLAALGALMATVNAGAVEKDFIGETEGLEVFNGHLVVKSNGTIGSVKTPYMFVGTNTNDFAEKAFTFKEMENTTSIAFENNYVYTTRQGDANHVYRFTVENDDTLNGLRSEMKVFDVNGEISGILAVKDGKIYTTSKDGKDTIVAGAAQTDDSPVVVPENLKDTVYGIANGAIYYAEDGHVKKYLDGEVKTVGLNGHLNDSDNKPVKIIAFDDSNVFILSEQGILYQNGSRVNEYLNSNVSGISVGEDGKSLIVTSTNTAGKKKVYSYNPYKSGDTKSTSVFSETVDKKELFTKKEATLNNLKYYVNNKKIGYSIAD